MQKRLRHALRWDLAVTTNTYRGRACRSTAHLFKNTKSAPLQRIMLAAYCQGGQISLLAAASSMGFAVSARGRVRPHYLRLALSARGRGCPHHLRLACQPGVGSARTTCVWQGSSTCTDLAGRYGTGGTEEGSAKKETSGLPLPRPPGVLPSTLLGIRKDWLDRVIPECTLTELQLGLYIYNMGSSCASPKQKKTTASRFFITVGRHGTSLEPRQLEGRQQLAAEDVYTGFAFYYVFRGSEVTGASCWGGTWGRYCG